MAEARRRDGGVVARRLRPLCWLVLAMPLHGLAAAGETEARTEGEIGALLDRVAVSGCRFQRNGNWYDGVRASAHLQRKHAYLRRRGVAVDAEGFIEHAASRSSVSGQRYRIACPGQPEQDASQWLRDRLKRLCEDRGTAT